MANKDKDLVDMILESILVAIGGALLGAFITHTKDPKKELQSAEDPGDWHVNIEPISCTNCNTTNESSETYCFSCGHELMHPDAPSEPSSDFNQFLEDNWPMILKISIGAVIGYYIYMLIVS